MKIILKKEILIITATSIALLFLLHSVQTKLVAYSFQGAEMKNEMAEAYQKWGELIEKQGALNAYSKIKGLYKGKNLGSRHVAGHVFGWALQEREGINSVLVCDQGFSFGCYHEVIGGLIATEGIQIINTILDICRSQGGYFTCLHALGHGIVAVTGYEKWGLDTAISICREFDPSDAIVFGCLGGMFMEWNGGSLLSGGQHPVAPPDLNYPLEPCLSVKDSHARKVCYFWIPQLWQRATINFTAKEKYTLMGRWCSLAETNEQRKTCASGVGHIASVEIGADSYDAEELCAMLGDLNLQYHCRTELEKARKDFWDI